MKTKFKILLAIGVAILFAILLSALAYNLTHPENWQCLFC